MLIDGRAVTDGQLAHSPVLAHLRYLHGCADIPIQPELFDLWRTIITWEMSLESLRPEPLCDLWEVRETRRTSAAAQRTQALARLVGSTASRARGGNVA
jgi:hypothetical protein